MKETDKFDEFRKELKELLKKYEASIEFDFAGDLLSASSWINIGGSHELLHSSSYICSEDL